MVPFSKEKACKKKSSVGTHPSKDKANDNTRRHNKRKNRSKQ